ncbi:hypothetical protein ACQPYH_00810 [Kribbella sp. CA-245084]|uniref:hypothetical protein n=1 Tax=Kribbella sp. CA-245084 TaxID=3239940 RepID=UPI003D91DA44
MCGKMDLGCYIQDGFQSVATNATDQLQQQASQAAMRTLDAMTFWIKPETPAIAQQHGESWTNTSTVEYLQHSLLGITGAVFVIAVLVAGMRIAWEQRARPLQELLKAILTFVVVGVAGTATMQLLIAWSDEFAVSIIHGVGQDMSLAAVFGGSTDGDGKVQNLVADGLPALLGLFSCLGVILVSLIQIVLMLIRSAMLVLLAGAFPLAAAATNTEIGRNWLRKFCAWSLAFIAYKPAAALVYAAAMKLGHDPATSTNDGVVRAMSGMMMLLLGLLALPALLRFMVPVTAAVAGGSAGMGSSVADPGGMATGAVNVGAGFSGSRGAGSSAGGSGGGAGGGGASGAQTVGAAAKAAGAAAGPAGIGLAAARKTAGGLAGAAAHSAGESGGGSITPASAHGPMAGGSRSRSARSASRTSPHPAAQQQIPEPAGPTGNG